MRARIVDNNTAKSVEYLYTLSLLIIMMPTELIKDRFVKTCA